MKSFSQSKPAHFLEMAALAIVLVVSVGCTKTVTVTAESPSSSTVDNSSPASDDGYKGQIPLANRIASKASLNVSNLPSLNPAGSVQIVAYLDPEDAFSARTYFALRQAAADNTSYNLVVRFKTDASTATFSHTKCRWLYAAAGVNRFWDMADLIFGNSLTITSKPILQVRAAQIGLSSTFLSAQLSDASLETKISDDLSSLQALGSNTAPSVYINGVRVYDFEVSSQDKVKLTIAKVVGG